MGLSVNLLTSGFLVTVIIFFVLTGILFYTSFNKMKEILLQGDDDNNDLETIDSALKNMEVAYILAFIAAGITLLLAFLYAGHELIIQPSEYWHLALYLITYPLLVISVIYAYLALNKLNTVRVRDKNGSDGYIWAGLLMSLFAFIGLTGTGAGRVGVNVARGQAQHRVLDVESNINEHLPNIRSKVEEIHQSTVLDKDGSGLNPLSQSMMVNRSSPLNMSQVGQSQSALDRLAQSNRLNMSFQDSVANSMSV